MRRLLPDDVRTSILVALLRVRMSASPSHLADLDRDDLTLKAGSMRSRAVPLLRGFLPLLPLPGVIAPPPAPRMPLLRPLTLACPRCGLVRYF